jgi:hypothetical protein
VDIKNYITSIRSLLYLALVLALLASLGHVAFAFATVNSGNLFAARPTIGRCAGYGPA